MSFEGFLKSDFETFQINGLEDRMFAIRNRIQPKFSVIGEDLKDHLAVAVGDEMFLHIAKHARRPVNPPKDTWLAVAEDKRGYKKHPHFQVGLFDDHVFIWLAFIYENPNKAEVAKKFLDDFPKLKQLPDDFVVSLDHTQKESLPITDLTQAHVERLRDVKKAEFLVGRHIAASNPLLQNGDRFLSYTKDTMDKLVPFYRLAKSI